jgi:predicted heme/steroid binding protein
MKLNFGKTLQVYYLVALTLLMSLVGTGVYLYWVKGPSNMEYVSMTFEAFFKLDSMKDSSKVKEIKSLIRSDRAREALNLLDTISEDVEDLNLVHEVDEYSVLSKQIKTVRKELGNFVSSPTASSINQVLLHKVSSFSSYVNQNQWRTLSRISRRLRSRLNVETQEYSYLKVRSLVTEIRKDIKTMKDVTMSSVLSRGDKANIVSKLKSFDTEIDLFLKYAGFVKSIERSVSTFDGVFTSWVKAISPEINMKRSDFEKNSQVLLYGFLILISFIVVIFIGGLFVYKSSGNRNRADAESYMMRAIKEGLIATEVRKNVEFSPESKEEFLRYREYVQKRMNFGGMFQEGMPFASILLDSHLKVAWGNPLFYKDWKVNEHNHGEESLTWDYLQKFTNLGENDPVFEAIENGIAGIYQVQVKMGEHDQMIPYEMYVSPLGKNKKENVLIIFYPLRSLEETLVNQTKSILGPVTRTLDLMIKDSFSGDDKILVEKDFNIAEIEDVYEKFEQLDLQRREEKDRYVANLEELEGKIYDNHKSFADVDGHLSDFHNTSADIFTNFESSKNHIIELVELRAMMEQLFFDIMNVTKGLGREKETLLTYSMKSQDNLIEGEKAFTKLFNLRDSFKEIKNNLEEYGARIGHEMDQLVIKLKNGSSIQDLDQDLVRYKAEIKSLTSYLGQMGKLMTSFDVSFSKIELILQERENVNFDQLRRTFMAAQEKLEDFSFEYNKYIEKGQRIDNDIVGALESLYTTFQQGRLNAHNAAQIVGANNNNDVPPVS